MKTIITEFKDLYNLYMVVLVIAIGLFTFFVDKKSLARKKLQKEANLARIIGISYILVGPILYIIFKML
ncbi:CLC_0170 family protein [Thermohalobacter berrensis]|uniref:CLC_0170 family protein n=1 Tax=Thermohalobacter berrensis TaxID=99594 RepID=UPI001601561A|nr:CLC_0170 family protein [Thermohalobacter berrensis]